MERMNSENSLERTLRNLPSEKVPADVYDRLQAKAAWNRPPVAHQRPFVIPILILLSLVVVFLGVYEFMGTARVATGNHPEESIPATMSPVIAWTPSAKSETVLNADYDPGGLSSRVLEMESAFEVRFGDSPTMLQAEIMKLDS